MQRWNEARSLVAAVLCLGSVGVAWAEDSEQSSYVPPTYQAVPAPTDQPSYQPVPGPTPSGAIIGYKPIPMSALETSMPSVVPAQPSAIPANPQVPQRARRSARGGAVQVRTNQPAYPAMSNGLPPSQSRAAEDSTGQLPAGYLTGIVGEGFYTLGRDDVIRVVVRNQPEFSGDFIIGFDGRIQYNYLGDIPVAGLTKYEVQQVLEKFLKRYIRIPDVNISILAYNSKVVYVIGEVNAPGKFIMRGDAIKLREAILAAGLPTKTAALGRVHVIKPDLEHPQVRVINVSRILYKGKLKDDVDLTSGEIVVIPSTVMSKVNDFLTTLLSPVTRAASVAWLAAL